MLVFLSSLLTRERERGDKSEIRKEICNIVICAGNGRVELKYLHLNFVMMNWIAVWPNSRRRARKCPMRESGWTHWLNTGFVQMRIKAGVFAFHLLAQNGLLHCLGPMFLPTSWPRKANSDQFPPA